jgi:hypothetical protein
VRLPRPTRIRPALPRTSRRSSLTCRFLGLAGRPRVRQPAMRIAAALDAGKPRVGHRSPHVDTSIPEQEKTIGPPPRRAHLPRLWGRVGRAAQANRVASMPRLQRSECAASRRARTLGAFAPATTGRRGLNLTSDVLGGRPRIAGLTFRNSLGIPLVRLSCGSLANVRCLVYSAKRQ